MGYWWEGSTSTAIPPTSISGALGQHNKIGGITFRTALIFRNILGILQKNTVPLTHQVLQSLVTVSPLAYSLPL